MKKKLVIFAAFMLTFGMLTNSSFAEEKNISSSIESLNREKKDFLNKFLMEKNVKELKDLSFTDINMYFDKIEELKTEFFKSNPELIKEVPEFRANHKFLPKNVSRNPYTGDVYVTYDTSDTKGDYVGHAGLGGYHPNSVFEMLPSTGLKLHWNRNSKWKKRKTGGRYEVRGAKKTHYDGAADYAYWKLGKGLPYKLLYADGENGDYCSGFVYRAWKSEGFDISNDNWIKPFIFPSDLAEDNDTYRVEKFGK